MRDIQLFLEWGHGQQTIKRMSISRSLLDLKGFCLRPAKHESCAQITMVIIEGCLSRLMKRKPYDYNLLVGHYVYMVSKRQMAKNRKKSEKQIR
jgi:hypothetical protein